MSTAPIVAGTDGSPRANLAMDRAGELGKALGAPVHVVCVPGALEAHEWPARISAQQIVAAAAERLQSQGVDTETHLPKDQGDAALALVAVADAVQAQMVVVGNKGMTGFRRLLGSFPNRVSHQARCDVLIVPTESPTLADFGGGSIVLGTDGSPAMTDALDTAIRLSKALGGELHLLPISKGSGSPEAALAPSAAKAADQGVGAVTHPCDGDPVDALLNTASQNDAAIIIVGSKGMHSAEREWFGKVSNKVSHKGAASVLIVRPAEADAG